MTEDLVGMPESAPGPSNFESRIIGCGVIFLPLLLVGFLIFLAAIGTTSENFYRFLFVLPCSLLIGVIGAFFLGPRLFPKLYVWIERHPAFISAIPGAVAGAIASLVGAWMPLLFLKEAGFYPFLALLLLSPAAILLGPVVGTAGGLVGGRIGIRFGYKIRRSMLINGAIGGGMAGLLTFLTITSLIIFIGYSFDPS